MKVKQFNLRMDESMYDAWRAAAERSGMTLTAWIKLRCNGTDLVAIPPRKAA